MLNISFPVTVRGKVLDIGIGENPYFHRFRTHCDADEYIGVDTDEKRLESARKKLEVPSPFKKPKKADFLNANATELPFPERSFDVAVMSNLISSPIHRNWDVYAPEHNVRGLGPKDLFYAERRKSVDEALRVLRHGGKLLIYTDLIVYGQHSYDMILRELEDATSLLFRVLEEEQRRVDVVNMHKVRSGDFCYCFLGDLLPSSAVYEVTKL